MKCPTCARKNRSGAQFCDTCGAKLHALAAVTGERRPVTALFCDIVDYTPLSERLDEEDLHAVVRAYQNAVSEVIARWDGHVESYTGDGVNAYFGFPHAHEDDAERAVRAALDIVASLGALLPQDLVRSVRTLPTFSVRVGIHTGPVVVGDLGGGERGKTQALGRTMNVAARLQRIAAPGAVVISDVTERLVAGMFVTDDLGIQRLKGVEEPMRAWVAVRSTGRRGRVQPGVSQRVPIVGRSRQIAELQSRWEEARQGRGICALISGEAGIGKSRLVRHFVESLQGTARTVELRCSPFHSNSPLYPLTERVRHALDSERTGSAEPIARRIEGLLTGAGMSASGADLVEAADLIAELVSAPRFSDAPVASETPAVRRSRMLDVLCELACAQAARQPSVLLVEDMHWADPTTIDFVGRLLRRSSGVPLLLLLTARPEFAAQWADSALARSVDLEPLSVEECATLFDELLGSRTVPEGTRSALLARSDGVPLFVEELTRELLDAGREDSDILSRIPDTLHGLLRSRIDRLSTRARETIHLASALSRDFRFDVLASVSAKSEAGLQADLAELSAAGLVYPRVSAAGESYGFKHALVAEAAYDSILRSDRRRLHRQIAERLAHHFPAIGAEQPEILAHHFAEAGEPDKAVEYWRSAGDVAVARGAYQEAVRHFDRGLQLLDGIADPRHRLQSEIELTESKGTALFSMLGYAHPAVESTFTHALSLFEREGSAPTLRALYGVWAVHVSRSNREAVDALLPRFWDLARTADPVALLTAHANAGMHAFFSADFERCLEQMTEASRWYATSEHSAFLKRHGYGGGLYPFAWRMWCLSILGRIDEAFAAEEELSTLAEQSGNPYGRAIANGFRVNLARDRRQPAETLELADLQIAYATRQMLPLWQGAAHCSRGWARACLGATADGISEITVGLQYLDMVGLRATYPYHLSALVEALLMSGDVDGALTAARRGLAMCESGLDRAFAGELRRLEAECLRQRGEFEAAEAGFDGALSLACRQSATFFAVRAADSLVRLCVERGHGDQARRAVANALAALPAGGDAGDVARLRQLVGAAV